MHRTAPVAAEYVPARQSVHSADPVDTLYFPAAHAVHVSPTGPVDPALQVQFVKAALPAGELEFDGQVIQFEIAEAPPAVQEATKPELTTLSSAVNNTCMYPVLDV